MAKATRSKYLFLICLALGLVFDVLFWDKAWGISFLIFVALLVGVGWWQSRRLGLRVSRPSWALAALAIFMAVFSAVRAEPFTLFITRLASICLLMLLAAAFLDRNWLSYNLRDFVIKIGGLLPVGLLASREIPVDGSGKQSGTWKSALPILTGLLLALPILLVLGSLLSSADAVFSRSLTGLFSFLKIENLPQYVFRAVLIFLIAVIVFGVYLYAFYRSKSQKQNQLVVKPFLGFTEATTVLVSLLLLFGAFVVIQFRYFFGGLANITNSGFTYAEYARRGFGEMVAVAFLSILFFWSLSAVTKRDKRQRSWFSGMGVLLFALVAVILASAFQRLFLYEDVYGFTQARLIPHVFMIWLGLLLLAFALLEVKQWQRYFTVAAVLAALGFAATFPLLNVDAFIVRANLARQNAVAKLDAQHLASLSADAVPGLYAALQSSSDPDLKTQLTFALACIASREESAANVWQSWSLSHQSAQAILSSLKSLNSFTYEDAGRSGTLVEINGEQLYCLDAGWD